MSEMYFPQLGFLELDKTKTGTAELFPSIWQLLEGLASPDVAERNISLDKLIETGAAKVSPLVAYILATRLIDPDIRLRCQVIKALGGVIAPSEGEMASVSVRRYLKAHCTLIGRGTVLAMLEAAAVDPAVESHIATLFNLCSHSGTVLIDLMVDRKVSLSLRRQSINFIGRVGFIEAIPYLQRLVDRLTTRLHGQKRMPFAPPSEPEETMLISALQGTLLLLQEL